jgi:Pectinacetylesterase
VTAAVRAAFALASSAFVLSAGVGAAAPKQGTGWQKVEPGGRTTCARGGKYAFWLRVADPTKLVVFFQGGGGCFDERTCALGSNWFDDSVDVEDDPSYAGGMLDLADRRNPFRGWSWLYVPSCTGDVHVGDRRVRYGRVTVEQRGWQNAGAALARAFRQFPRVQRVLVVGCSAGSAGSAFHVPTVLERWPRAQTAQLGDSLAFVYHRPIRLTGWGAHRHFPPFFRIGSRRFTMVEYLRALAREYPNRTFARFNHAGDDVQEAFYGAVGGDPADFEARLRAAERALKRVPNYRSYLACGNEHCSLPTGSFYSTRVGGVGLRDWVADLGAGKDVACPTCRPRR